MDVSMKILRIDSSAQTETSQTRRLSDRIIDGLHALGKSPDVTVRDLDKRLPQLDRAWSKPTEPPHLNWSSAMFRKRRTDNDEQTTEAGRDYHEVEAS